VSERGLGSETIGSFLDDLASDAATPGGGAVAGLSASAGAALISMVCNLTIGRDKYEDVEEEMRDHLEQAEAARGAFLDLAERDERAFEAVMTAFKMPKADDREKAERSAAIQRAYEGAARVPIEVARKAVGLMPSASACTARGNVNAASDGLVAALALFAAAHSALANVDINAAGLRDESVAGELRSEATSLKARADELLRAAQAAFAERMS
jgi:formiminotetrahydrofolate cyclodeaminase